MAMEIFECNSDLREVIAELTENKIAVFDSTTAAFKNSFDRIKVSLHESIKPSINKGLVMHYKKGPVCFLYDNRKYRHQEACDYILDIIGDVV